MTRRVRKRPRTAEPKASPLRVCLVSLGCPKNLVDSEVMAGRLVEEGFELAARPGAADAAVVNTCGFTESAREESLAVLEELGRLKARGRPAVVVAVGCLVQRVRKAFAGRVPAVDAWLPLSDYSGLPRVLGALARGRPRGRLPPAGRPRTAETDLRRLLLTRPHTAYLRIAEGCNHRCAFCAIPSIRGRLRSKPLEILVMEAAALAAVGVKELVLVAEDTTDYGRDLAGRPLLPELLRRLGRIEGLAWIRILYAYPSRVTDELIREMAENSRVVPYLDLPIQHVNARILRSMRRGTPPARIRERVAALRQGVPGVALRTSVIVGYPGEGEEEFGELEAYLASARFERVGAFTFSPETGTAAAREKETVPRDTVEDRYRRILTLGRRIIRERNKSLVGRRMEVIVDDTWKGHPARGRTFADAPEIDCSIRIQGKQSLEIGDLIQARITGYRDYDLEGVVLQAGMRSGEKPP